MARPRAVLFDLGRVLVGFDWGASLSRLAQRTATPTQDILDWLLAADGPHDAYCLGRIDDRTLLDHFHRRFPSAGLDDAWLRRLWCDMFTPWPESLALVDALRGQCHLGLVSNTNAMHFEHLDRELDLRRRFDACSLSHEVGAMKPSDAILDHALGAAGVGPADAFFTDDIAAFTRAAAARGLATHTFDGAEALAHELREWGFRLI